MAAGGGEGAWSVWEIVVTFLGGGGLLTGIGGILWVGRKYGQNEVTMATLRDNLDAHIAGDETMFDELKADIAENAHKQDQRHEENLKALGKLPDRDDIRDLRDQLTRRFEIIEGLVRVRPPS